MTRIVCGFCSAVTEDGGPCLACRHDPVIPYTQRGSAPVIADASLRLSDALAKLGADATAAELADHLDVSERTVRRWQADGRLAS